MELSLSNTLLASDPRLIDHIVGEVKSQGIFDKFRKECIADVDTKPAYQNLRTRVESSVNSFLSKQIWRTDLNKNQLRETLRKHIHDAPYLEVGVERIVDQVVNPKIYSVFMPQVEDVVYKFLGIERPKPQRNGACDLKDLLPKDLDPVSPESDRNSLKDISLESVDEHINEVINGNDQKPNNKFVEEVQDPKYNFVEKEIISIENGENSQNVVNPPVKTILNSSFKSDETNKTEEEEEDSPVFEPIDIMNLNESNMSNDSHLSGISELTSHRSQSPDFMTEFSRDNLDCSNQDSQLSKVSSNSRLSIVTDFGLSNHASTPLFESKDDLKYTKDHFKVVREFDTVKDNKFNFEVIKNKDNSKISNYSKENSRDAYEYKDNKIKDELKSKYSKDKYDSKNIRDKDYDSKTRYSKSDKYSRGKNKDKYEFEFQESKENSYNKLKENKMKDTEKNDEVKDLKDLYKEKIRELREKKELTEKEKLGKDNKDSIKINKDFKEKKDTSSKDKDDYKKSYKCSSSSRSSSYNSKISRAVESKDSRDKNNSKRDDRRHSNGKSESKSNTKSKRDSKIDTKSESKNTDKSFKDKKRRDEKKSKSIDDHSSLRKNSNDRRSTDRDGSNGSSSKYSNKSSYSATNTSGKFGPSNNLTKDTNKDHHSSSEASDNVHDNLKIIFGSSQYVKDSIGCKNIDNQPKKLDPGTVEICLPLKKRPLYDGSMTDNQSKKTKIENIKESKKKIEKDIFRIDTDVTSVPDEERVQIIEIPDEEYEQPYPNQEPILSIEETKKIILDPEPMHPVQSKLSEMEQSIRQSLSEMMSDHKLNEAEDALTYTKLFPVMDSNTLLETLTDDSNNDSESLVLSANNTSILKNLNLNIEETIFGDIKENIEILENTNKKETVITKDIAQDNKTVEKIQEFTEKQKIVKIKEIEKQINEHIQVNINFDHDEKTSELNVNKNEGISENRNNLEIVQNIQHNATNTNIKIDLYIEKNEEKNVDIINKNIMENVENIDKKIEKSLQKTQHDVEELRINVKDFLDKSKGIKNATKKLEIDNTSLVEIVDDVHKNKESGDDNVNKYNEEDKLIIDEEFIGKEIDKVNESQIKAKINIDENLHQYNQKEKIDEVKDEFNDYKIEKRNKVIITDQNHKKDIKIKNNINEKNMQDIIHMDNNYEKKTNKNNDNCEKSIKFVQEIIGKQIKNRIMNKLNKFKDENRTIENKFEEDKIIDKTINRETVLEMSIKEKIIEKFDENNEIPNKSVEKENVENSMEQIKNIMERESVQYDKMKMYDSQKMNDDSNENYDNKNVVKAKKLCIIHQGEGEEIEQELISIFNKDLNNLNEINTLLKSGETKFNINSFTSKKKREENQKEEKEEENNDLIQNELFKDPTTSSEIKMNLFKSNRNFTSPVEEECHYLENDNHKYLAFKKYLEKLEADPNRSLEDMIESYGGVVVPALPMAAPILPLLSIKRKHSTSPLIDILMTNSNNNNDRSTKETTSEETSENSSIIKKRKVGRVKKASGGNSIAANLQQEQLLKPQLNQQQPQLQPQQVAIINGENFVMPLSPESDVSATSEKNPGNALKDERSRHRNNQRYSSDDLYKPRPLFSSSSRRNRRFHQA